MTMEGDVFVRRWTSLRAKTLAFMSSIPEPLLGFSPQEGYRSVEQMIRHLMAAEHAVIQGLQKGDFRWREGEELVSGVSWRNLAALAGELDATLVALAATPSQEWLSEIPPGSLLSRGEWLWQLLEHEVHHRGQLSLMLRLGGRVMPPLYE